MALIGFAWLLRSSAQSGVSPGIITVFISTACNLPPLVSNRLNVHQRLLEGTKLSVGEGRKKWDAPEQ